MKNRELINKIVIISMFSALACAGTFIQIKMPTGDMIHLGNFVMIIAALLCGGIVGGVSGSLGMGLYDIIYYSQKPSTIIRTFLLKFLVGFLVGYLFRLVLRKKVNTKVSLSVLGGMSLLIGLIFLIVGLNGHSYSGFGNAVTLNMFGHSRELFISWYIPIFTFISGVLLIFAGIFSRHMSVLSSSVLFSITISMIVNILGEFILRFLLEGIMVSDFKTSMFVATSKIPGSIITAFISIMLTVLIFESVYRGLRNTKFFNDELIEENFDDNKL